MKTVANAAVDKTQQNLTKNRKSQRDSYGLAAAFLPLVGVIIWLGLILINALIIDQSRQLWDNTIKDKKAQIVRTYTDTLMTHGELVVKTNHLAGVIEKDIQPEEVFILVEKLFPVDPGFTVTGFGRETDGSFSVTISADSYLKFAKIVRRFNSYEKVKDVQARDVSVTKSNLVIGSINFSFISAELNSATKSKSTTSSN
jgi:hypothetical protein